MYGERNGSTDTIVTTIKSSFCKQDNSYSGLPCASYFYVTPGVYEISVKPWGIESNSVSFTVTSSQVDISNWKTYTNNEYGFEIQHPASWKEIWSSFPEYKKAALLVSSESGNVFTLSFNDHGDVGQGTFPDIAKINIAGLSLQRFTYAGTINSSKYDVIATYCPAGYQNCEIMNSTALYDKMKFDLTCDFAKYAKEDCNNLFNKILSTFKFTK
jgi:hypothetical protein